jgi:hypothetical protein
MCRSAFVLYWRQARPEARLNLLAGLKHVKATRDELAIELRGTTLQGSKVKEWIPSISWSTQVDSSCQARLHDERCLWKASYMHAFNSVHNDQNICIYQ